MEPSQFTNLVQALCLAPDAAGERAAREAFLVWAMALPPDGDVRAAARDALQRLYPFVAAAPAVACFEAHLAVAARTGLTPHGRTRRARRLH